MNHLFLLKQNAVSVLVSITMLLLLSVLSGCASLSPKTIASPEAPTTTASAQAEVEAFPQASDDPYADDLNSDIREEVVELAIPPLDDGVPLSLAERRALLSHGELDRNLDPEDYREVLLHFKYYAHRARGTMRRMMERIELYLPYVQEHFASRGLPVELSYLAIVESGYNPHAVSHSGAAGVWQFMPPTGRHYGLRNDWWVDERRDPFEATSAAADYLTKLYGDFGDWFLAIAAYNAGEGKIGRALAATGAKDFFELARMNTKLKGNLRLKDETLQYVPRFIAITKIMRNLDILEFPTPNPNAAINPVALTVRPGTDLLALSQELDMSWKTFSQHNAAFRRYVTPPDSDSIIYVHQKHEQIARALLAKPQKRYAGWKPYTIKKGDTLGHISRRTGVPVSVLSRVNNVSPTRLRIGAKLMLPAGTKWEAKKQTPRQAIAERRGNYNVQAGDTLYAISRKHGVALKTLMAANGITNVRHLKIGQNLYIPSGSNETKVAVQSSTSPATQVASRTTQDSAVTYTVQQGDTMWGIARKFNVSHRMLMRHNNISANTILQPGDAIVIRAE